MVMMMSVCCVCGDEGRIKELVRCVECRFHVSVVHRYCKRSQEDGTSGWTCDECLEQKMMQLREASRKSSRMQDRWIRKSNYKAILYKPEKAKIRGSSLDNIHSETQMAIHPAKGFLEDNVGHFQHLEQQKKTCFRCGLEGNSTVLIDCQQCHSSFVHSRCKLSQENGSPDWTCDHCMEKKSMQLIDQQQIRQKSRMRAGWVPRKKLSDKHLKLGFHDRIFRKECGVRPSKESNHGRASNNVNKLPTPKIHSTSIRHNGTQVENRLRRTIIMDCSDIFGDDDYAAGKATREFQNAQYRHRQVELGNGRRVDHAATKAKRGLSHVVRDWPEKVGPRSETSSDKKRDQMERQLDLKDPAKRLPDNSPAEPIMNPLWQGYVHIHFGSDKTSMELLCYQSTRLSSEFAEAVKGLAISINVAVRCRSVVWPRRFLMAPPSNKAIDVYFLPKSEKDVAVYDEMLGHLEEHKLALLYEMPSENQNLLIFPSCILPVESHRLQKKYYMWGALEEKGKR